MFLNYRKQLYEIRDLVNWRARSPEKKKNTAYTIDTYSGAARTQFERMAMAPRIVYIVSRLFVLGKKRQSDAEKSVSKTRKEF